MNKLVSIKSKTVLRISLALNVLLVLALVVAILPDDSAEIAQYNRLQEKLCGQGYDNYLKQWGEAHGEEGQKSFAMLVCLKNYKTGAPLDLKPLSDQVK